MRAIHQIQRSITLLLPSVFVLGVGLTFPAYAIPSDLGHTAKLSYTQTGGVADFYDQDANNAEDSGDGYLDDLGIVEENSSNQNDGTVQSDGTSRDVGPSTHGAPNQQPLMGNSKDAGDDDSDDIGNDADDANDGSSDSETTTDGSRDADDSNTNSDSNDTSEAY